MIQSSGQGEVLDSDPIVSIVGPASVGVWIYRREEENGPTERIVAGTQLL